MTRKLAITTVLTLVVAGVAQAGVPDWVRAAASVKVPASKAKAVVLLDETILNVDGSGSITTRHRKATKILTSAGRDYGYAAVPFDRDTKLLSFRAWSLAADGTPYEVRERDAIETSPYDGELYSDSRVKVLRIPAADAGSVVAFEYEQRERPYMLQDVWHFQSELPVVRATFALVHPPSWSYDVRWSRYPAVEPVAGGGAVTWEVRDVPGIEEEAGMPATSVLAGRMAIALKGPSQTPGKQTWSDIASFFHGLAASRVAPTPPLQAKVKELTNGAATNDSVRALARFAQRDVRYVAIEIGIGGYQPHAASDIFANRYGDCKDKATLLRTMLREIGVESYYVLVNTTRGVLDPDMPTMGSFDHVILAIRLPQAADKMHAIVDHPKAGKLLLFDPTSTTTPFGLLPSYLQASRGLLVLGDGGGDLIAMPAHSPDTNQLRRSAKLQLGADGTLKGEVEEIRTGRIAAEMRGTLQTLSAAERTRFVETTLSAHLAHYNVTNIAVDNVDDPEADLVTRYAITVPSYAARVGDMLLVRPRVLGQKPETVVDLAERKQGYVTEGPSVQSDDIEIAVSAPLAVDELPAPVTVATPSVQYSSKSEFKDGVLRYRRRYSLQSFFIAREALPELNKAFSQILADERASAIFK